MTIATEGDDKTSDTKRKRRDWTIEEILAPLGKDKLPLRERGAGASGGGWMDGYKRNRDCFVEAATGQPGPYLRWLCLLRLVCERHVQGAAAGGRWRSARDPLPPALPEKKEELVEALKAALQRASGHDSIELTKDQPLRGSFYYQDANVWPAKTYADPREPVYRALDQCLKEIRQSDGLPPLDLEDLLTEEVLHPGEELNFETVERFSTWLECDFKPAQEDLSRLQGEIYAEGKESERALQMNALVSRLLADTDADFADYQPLTNVWSDDQRTGLRAFATRLCLRIKQELARWPRGRRPALIYIPLDRIPTDAQDMRPSRRDVVRILNECLGFPNEQPAGPSLPSAADIERIQHALTQRRILLILDGIEVASPPFGGLFDVIRAADWTSFVRTLVQPADKALDLTRGQYRSRVVALSNRPLKDLRAWMKSDPETLPRIPATEDMEALIRNFRGFPAARLELGAQVDVLWPSPYSRPKTQPSAHSLDNLFQLRVDTAVEFVNEMQGVPSELDLALAWCADRSGCKWPGASPAKPWNQMSRDSWRMLIFKTWLYDHNHRTDAGAWNSRAAVVALQFIALSINGLRLTTLDRALARFGLATNESSLLGSITALRGMLSARGGAEAFAKEFRPLIDQHEDGDLIELPDAVRWFELRVDQDMTSHAPLDKTKLVFDLRSEKVREWIMGDLLSDKALEPRFRLINSILAEESIAQATAQARRLHNRAHDVLSLRRFLQVAFHGLMSLDLNRLDSDCRTPISAFGAPQNALPEDAYRGYVYLYEFVYRKCIENAPAWLLGRGLGREDVRSALLAIFANPGWARHVLATQYSRREDDRSFTAVGAFRRDRIGRRPAFDPREPYLRGALGLDLFSALMHSAFRGGRHADYAQHAETIAAAWVDPVKPPADRDGGPGPRRPAHVQFEFAKIAIDSLQAMSDLAQVERRCREQLSRLGARFDWTSFTTLGSGLEQHRWEKRSFESAVLVPVVENICPPQSSQTDMEKISDILFRIGEFLATRADFHVDPLDTNALLVEYANAYAVFWIGDRLRASSASLDLSEVNWPAVSARATRYSVRVSLKIGKLVTQLASRKNRTEPQPSAEAAFEFYGHARGRIDVYSRHLYRFPVERVHALLLLAAAARVRASMSRSDLNALADPRSTQDYLGASYDYLCEARRQMLENEFNRSLLKRYLLERVKTLGKLGGWGGPAEGRPAAQSFTLMACNDLKLLERLSKGHGYWEQILHHMRANRGADLVAGAA